MDRQAPEWCGLSQMGRLARPLKCRCCDCAHDLFVSHRLSNTRHIIFHHQHSPLNFFPNQPSVTLSSSWYPSRHLILNHLPSSLTLQYTSSQAIDIPPIFSSNRHHPSASHHSPSSSHTHSPHHNSTPSHLQQTIDNTYFLGRPALLRETREDSFLVNSLGKSRSDRDVLRMFNFCIVLAEEDGLPSDPGQPTVTLT